MLLLQIVDLSSKLIMYSKRRENRGGMKKEGRQFAFNRNVRLFALSIKEVSYSRNSGQSNSRACLPVQPFNFDFERHNWDPPALRGEPRRSVRFGVIVRESNM